MLSREKPFARNGDGDAAGPPGVGEISGADSSGSGAGESLGVSWVAAGSGVGEASGASPAAAGSPGVGEAPGVARAAAGSGLGETSRRI